MNTKDQLIVQGLALEISQHFPMFKEKEFNTHENCARFLWAVCNRATLELPELKLGLLTKNPGENGYTWPNKVRTSHDAVAIPNGERFDLIGSAGDTTIRPSVTWKVVPKEEWRPHNVWIPHTKVASESGMPTTPQEPEMPSNPVKKLDYERDFGGDARGVVFMRVLFSDYLENKVPPNPGMGTWPWRVMFDTMYNNLIIS